MPRRRGERGGVVLPIHQRLVEINASGAHPVVLGEHEILYLGDPRVAKAAAITTATVIPRRSGPTMDPQDDSSASAEVIDSYERAGQGRRSGDLNPGWAVNPNRISRVIPAVRPRSVSRDLVKFPQQEPLSSCDLVRVRRVDVADHAEDFLAVVSQVPADRPGVFGVGHGLECVVLGQPYDPGP